MLVLCVAPSYFQQWMWSAFIAFVYYSIKPSKCTHLGAIESDVLTRWLLASLAACTCWMGLLDTEYIYEGALDVWTKTLSLSQ